MGGWVTNEKIMPIPVFQLKVCQLDRVWQLELGSVFILFAPNVFQKFLHGLNISLWGADIVFPCLPCTRHNMFE